MEKVCGSLLQSPIKEILLFQFLFFFFYKKIWNTSQICMSSLHRGHANLPCSIPMLVRVLPERALYSFFLVKFKQQNVTISHVFSTWSIFQDAIIIFHKISRLSTSGPFYCNSNYTVANNNELIILEETINKISKTNGKACILPSSTNSNTSTHR